MWHITRNTVRIIYTELSQITVTVPHDLLTKISLQCNANCPLNNIYLDDFVMCEPQSYCLEHGIHNTGTPFQVMNVIQMLKPRRVRVKMYVTYLTAVFVLLALNQTQIKVPAPFIRKDQLAFRTRIFA